MSYQLTKEELRSNKKRREEFKNLERNNIYIVLDSLKCAHNVGTILRLSDALLARKSLFVEIQLFHLIGKLNQVQEVLKFGFHGNIMKMQFQ